MGTARDETIALLLDVHVSLVRQTVLYSLSFLHRISPSLDIRLRNLPTRSLGLCLLVPRTTPADVVLAGVKGLPVVTQSI